MGIKGSLKEASFPDVIQLLSMGQKTGILTVIEKGHFGSITFYKGKIVDSYLINRKNRIGELLLNSGELSKEQLSSILETQKRTGERLGSILLKEKFVSKSSLLKYLKQQIKETIFTMMSWDKGYFNFEPRFSDVYEESIAIDPESLLLESAKRADELSAVSLDILRDSSILNPTSSPEKISGLSEKEKRVYSLLDGEKTLEVLIEASPFDRFETKELMSSLVRKEFCSVIDGIRPQSVSTKISEHLNLGLAFLKTQLYDESEREFKHVIELDPENREARFYLSVILTKTKNYRKAEDLLHKLLEEDPDIPIYENNLGYILEVKEKIDDAFEFYRKASRMKSSGIPLLNMAIILFRRREFSASMKYLLKALEIDHKLVLARFYISLLNIISGDYLKAIHEIKAIIKVEPEVPVLYHNLAVISEKLGNQDEAEKYYKKALDLAPSYIKPQIKLGELYYKKGLYPSAQRCFKMIIDVGLGKAELFLKLGNICYRLGQKEDAIEQWKKALELDPKNGVAKRNIEMVGE